MYFIPIAADSFQAQAANYVAGHASTDATNALTEVQIQKLDVERLLMITEALWTLMKNNLGYCDSDLHALIREIDLRDGKLDGKVAATPPRKCPHCGQTLEKLRPVCIYCAKPVPRDLFER